MRGFLGAAFLGAPVVFGSPTIIKTFTTGTKDSLGLVHEAEMGWTTSVVQPGGDAEKEGITLGWRLIEVNGETTQKKSNYWMVSKLGERPLELKYRLDNHPELECSPDNLKDLYKAMHEGRVREVLEILEDYKCDLNTKPKDEDLPLVHLAAKIGDMAKIRALHKYGARIDEDFEGARPLHLAIIEKMAYASHWLVTLGADLNAVHSSGLPAAHLAAKHCAAEVLKVFRMKQVKQIYDLVDGKSTEDFAREGCEDKVGDMLARWTKEHKEEAHASFTSKLKSGEL